MAIDRKRTEETLLKSEGKLAGYANQMEQFSLSAASMISLKDEKVIFTKISRAIVDFSDFRRVIISLFKDEHPFREVIGYGGVSEELAEKIRRIPLPKSWYDHVFSQGHHLGQCSYYIPHTMKHILNQEANIYGEGPPPEDSSSAWHPEDNLFVRMNDENGQFIGVLGAGGKYSGGGHPPGRYVRRQDPAAPDQCHHAPDEWPGFGTTTYGKPTRTEMPVHVRVYRRRYLAAWGPRCRGVFHPEALFKNRTGRHNP